MFKVGSVFNKPFTGLSGVFIIIVVVVVVVVNTREKRVSSEYVKVAYKQNGELHWVMVPSLLLLTPSWPLLSSPFMEMYMKKPFIVYRRWRT